MEPRAILTLPTKALLCAFGLLAGCSSDNPPDPAPEPTLAQRSLAAQATAEGNPACTGISAFHWQIGDGDGLLAEGSGGVGTPPTADTDMLIASASKWLWGAYVVERRQGQLTAGDRRALTMRSGYTDLSYSSCIKLLPANQAAETVRDCLETGNNGAHEAQYDGSFYYNGGHFQKQAVDLGLGDDNSVALQADVALQIGQDIPFAYDSPQPAAGIRTSASGYAVFLRKLLNHQLLLADLLGADTVCTNPSTCASADYTPVPSSESWHYGLGYWVEDDPDVGDDAYSSPGAFGFYPWIDRDRRWYGVLARHSDALNAYRQSDGCGRLIRAAWATGQTR